ncbi:hypothetical protein REJC140_02141 [Pseudorhizobium endolithicum]|uniref:Glycosyltransferase RgtA/B/C/D-like domain-containing protein n=1 Tax=Pseudorhizobium endolithicum TaxID=1191678 RepID=A0ABM8PXY3_9HYPH|nr:hypothetical protein [Pseudorhizobium endolithicum]CAD7054344.1 hypothetical protein REJC140_02141 [Pseudorhizobium endolithicum]
MTSSETATAASSKAARHSKWRPALRLRFVILFIGIILAAVLSLPGETVTTKYVNDLFIFLDGAHRIWSGQVPNIDFHSSLGPLAFYIPAAGYGISGTLSGAMPAGMALVVLLLALIASEVIATRMRTSLGLPLAVFLLLAAAVPVNPGEWIGELSFAMFYNRIGWAALGLLLVMYLPRQPDQPRRQVVDALCAAVLSLLMLYTKITYGLMAMSFLTFMLLDRRQFPWSAMALAMVLVSVGIIELLWQGSSSHLEDLRLAGSVSGDLPTLRDMADVILKNLADITVFGIFAGLLLLLRRRLRDILFVGFCVASGLLIIEQNFQIVGILTLGAGAAVIAELLLRPQGCTVQQRWARGLPLLLGALILPPTVSHAISLTLHPVYAVSGKGEQLALPAFEGIRLVPMWSRGQYDFFRRYNASMADGAAALTALGGPVERVAVLDFVNPFSAGMDLDPPAGDSPWYHWGRTIDRSHFPAPEVIFADAEFIMDPKSPIEIYTAGGMREVYGAYITERYVLVSETSHWIIYRRR